MSYLLISFAEYQCNKYKNEKAMFSIFYYIL